MLTRLSIRDIVLIDRLDLDVTSGLSVLTGETGAGKSILLDAFALALGARGDVALVRQGAEKGQVTAAFELPAAHPVRTLMAANDIAADDELILRRVQFADGRTRAFVNDQPVSVQALKILGAALVEIHGQHDERALVDAATHRRLLDAFGGPRRARPRRSSSCGTSCALREAALVAQRAEVERAQREAEWLRHAAAELAQLSPQPAEESALAERRAAMMQAEKVAGDLRDAHDAVAGQQSPVPALAAAARRLERRGAQVPALVEPALKALDVALTAHRGGARASRRRVAHRRSRSERARADRGAPVRAARRGPQVQRAGRRAGGAGGPLWRRPRPHRCGRQATRRARGGGARRRRSATARPRWRCPARARARPRSSTAPSTPSSSP